jgi:hypothetical protein
MKWNIFSIIAFVLIIPLFVKWYADSEDYGQKLIYSRDSKTIETKKHDDLLDTDVTESKTTEGFWMGLLPGTDAVSLKAMIAVVPLGGVLFVLGSFGIFMHIRKKRKLKN